MFLRRLMLAVTALATALGLGLVGASSASAVGDKDCGDFASQRAAQIFYLNHGGPAQDPHRLDSDSDGIACETNPGPYYYGSTPPGSNPDPKPETIRSKIQLDLSRAKAIAGERIRLAARVAPRTSRTVVFQQRVSRRWQPIKRKTTSRKGRATYTVRAPRRLAEYRAVVIAKKVGKKKYTAATSRARSLRIEKQAVDLRLSRTSVVEDGGLKAVAVARPVRVGRKVTLQVRDGGTWQPIGARRQNRRGKVSWNLPADEAGTFKLRAVVSSHRGAAAKASRVRNLEVRDVTSPAVPAGLVAVPGDGQVSLTWGSVGSPDLVGYQVYVKAPTDLTWRQIATTELEEHVVSGLLNGVEYQFTVASVDGAGNVSGQAAAAAATPLAPIE